MYFHFQSINHTFHHLFYLVCAGFPGCTLFLNLCVNAGEDVSNISNTQIPQNQIVCIVLFQSQTVTQNLHSSRQEVLKSNDRPRFGHVAWPRKTVSLKPAAWPTSDVNTAKKSWYCKKRHLEQQDYTMNKLVRKKKQSHGTNTSSYLLAGLYGSVVLLAMMQRNALWMETYSSQPRSMNLFWEFSFSVISDQTLAFFSFSSI